MSVCRTTFAVLAWGAATLLAPVYAAPPITVTPRTPTHGPIEYTVRVASKSFGDVEETRTISSGQTDDFTWKTAPPGGPVPVAEPCPGHETLALDANGAAVRQLRVRLAPIVADNGTATVQMSVQASAPTGKTTINTGGKTLQCPRAKTLGQVVRFTMPTDGTQKTIALNDGSRVTVSAKR
jgi:hypothetical protein